MIRESIAPVTYWEPAAGKTHSAHTGSLIQVAGNPLSDEHGQVIGADIEAQARYVFLKIEAALRAAGASLHDVVNTRMFLTDVTRWEAVARVHGEFFRDVRPAATMVAVNRLIDPAMLIVIEVDAVVA